jgi:carbonic anhydrase
MGLAAQPGARRVGAGPSGVDMNQLHKFGCSCCADMLAGGFAPLASPSRRHVLRAAGSIGLFTLLAPFSALAATGHYEAMVLGCIDPRLQEPYAKWTAAQGLTGQFSQFMFAGAAIGAVAPAFKDWHKTFWDNLAATIQLHNIKKVIAIDHRDCGAAKIAYGDAAVADTAAETETHRKALAEFRKQVGEKQSKLEVVTGLMALDGTFEPLG